MASSRRSPSRSSPSGSGRGSATGPTTRHPCCSSGPSLVLVPLVDPALAARGADLVVCSSTRRDPRAAEVAATLLRIFAVQVPLYGAGHHPHRAAAGPPALPRGRAGAAGVLDRRARVLPLVRLDRRRPGRPVAGERRGDPGARLGHHARCRGAVGAADRAGDAHRLAVAARRCGCRRGRPPDRRPRRCRDHRAASPSRPPWWSPCGCPRSPATSARSPSTPTRRRCTCCPTRCSPCRSPRAPSRRSPRAAARARTSPERCSAPCGPCSC